MTDASAPLGLALVNGRVPAFFFPDTTAAGKTAFRIHRRPDDGTALSM